MGAVLNYHKQVERFEAETTRAVVPAPPTKGRPAVRFKRDFDAARIDRLTSQQPRPITTGDMELCNSLASMRAASRELERNNDYAKKFLHMVETNVVGKTGFTLKNRARDLSGNLDKGANVIIESEWKAWGKRGNCTADGLLSWTRAQKLIIRTIARDGEVLVRLIRGFKNPWKFAIQILEADVLDEQMNISDGQGRNLIKMGIEYDEWGKPVAYHLREKHPGDYFSSQKSTNTYKRVPANEIVHVFWTERPTQNRGIPWMRTAARRMNLAGEYEYAELVAARIGASKMGFYIPNPDGGADIVGDDEDEQGNPIQEAEPGVFEKLPSGYNDFKAFMPEHPTGNYGPFMKEVKRGMSSGLNVAYNSMANDLEGVNFSSMRVGTIDDRDSWKDVQNDFADDCLQIVRAAWLEMLLLTNRTNLPYSKYEKFNQAEFHGRSWDWVDPEKDINAANAAVRSCLSSLTDECAARGVDFEDVLEKRADEIALAKKYGVEIDLGGTTVKPGPKEVIPPADQGGTGNE
jgi:lambda family phage portal protein